MSDVHVVLVPGFGGFDVLGNLQYYAGLTPLLARWQDEGPDARRRVTLHYFDNLPAASVHARALRLRDYLAKRVARREFRVGDHLVLVGHSTGGLDVRALLRRLSAGGGAGVSHVDGGRYDAVVVEDRRLLAMIRGVAFLSVPHLGTNSASWVRDHAAAQKALRVTLRRAVELRRLPGPSELPLVATWALSRVARSGLLDAARDALAESDDGRPGLSSAEAANAREAYAQIELWTRNIDADAMALDDLAVREGERATEAIARREAEREVWSRYGVETLSFATVARCPDDPSRVARMGPLSLVNPLTWPDPRPRPDVDLVFRLAYRACVGGPLEAPADAAGVTFDGRRRPVAAWENDGVVNTASMLWPDGPRTVVVDGDHADIMGHYRAVDAREGSARRYYAYDLFQSASGFSARDFDRVWESVLDFALRAADA